MAVLARTWLKYCCVGWCRHLKTDLASSPESRLLVKAFVIYFQFTFILKSASNCLRIFPGSSLLATLLQWMLNCMFSTLTGRQDRL